MHTMRAFAYVACMAICAMPCVADTWTDPATGIEWTYTVIDGKAFLGGGTFQTPAVARASAFDLVIPDTLGGHPVGGISAYGFYDFPHLTNIVISGSVASIGDNAFSWCRTLTTLVIPGSVKTIGRDAFSGCYELKEVVLHEGLCEIGSHAFQTDSSLDGVTIPNSVTNIGFCAFDQTSIRRATIGTGVEKIGNLSFGRCRNLSEVEFRGDRNAIDMDVSMAFEQTPWLESLDFGLCIDKYHKVTGFTGQCPAEIRIPDGVSAIGSSAFDSSRAPSVTNLVSVILPDTLEWIGDGAFQGCANLQSINIPASLERIDRSAFSGCISLSSVSFEREDHESHYDMTVFKGTPFADTLPFKLLFSMRDGEPMRLFVDGYIGRCPNELDVWAVLHEQWERDRKRELERHGFDIGEAPPVSGVAGAAFAQSGLKRVILPASLAVIEDSAFRDCTNLTRVVFNGDAPAELGAGLFWNVHPDCVAFVPVGSTGWGVEIPGVWREVQIRHAATGVVVDGVLVSVDLGDETEYTIPSGVTNVAANAFAGCGELERIVIPDGVARIDRSAFDGCGKLWARWYKALAGGTADAPGAPSPTELSLTVTNVVMHYVTASVQSGAVTPPNETGLVNVIAEVTSGGPVAIASTWAAQYAGFEAAFGSDFTAALTKQTGKRDGAGHAMLVWQDYVAGTDPTDPDDTFTASITFDAQGRPVISHSPELPAAEAAKRTYRKFGKARLNDANWTEIADGEEANYNFFKVTVEMK